MDLDELEICLIPFTTVVALESCATGLHYDGSRRMVGTCQGLEEYVMTYSAQLLPDTEPDDVLFRMWSEWRADTGGWHSLVDLLAHLMNELLEIQDGGPACKSGVGPEVWTRFKHRFDPVVALCIFAATKEIDGAGLRRHHFALNYHDVEFEEVLNHPDGLAETHMHVNAALTSECAWCLTVCAHSPFTPGESDFSAQTVEEGGPADSSLLCWLHIASITRTLLFQHVKEGATAAEFAALAPKSLQDAAESVLGTNHVAQRIAEAWTCSLHQDSEAIRDCSETDWWKVLEELEVRVWPTSVSGGFGPQTLEETIWAERRMILDVLRSVFEGRASGKRSAQLEGAFLQYVRVRNLFHRSLAYSAKKGLREFSRRFGRGSRYFKRFHEDDTSALRLGLDQLDPDREVTLWELRYSPRTEDESGDDQLHRVDSLRKILESIEEVEGDESPKSRRAGMIFHFLKPSPLSSKPTPMLLTTRERLRADWRYADRFSSHLEEASMLFALWRFLPQIAPWFCGFDVAGYENFEEEAPSWIYLAILKKLREDCRLVAFKGGVEPPKFTWHAGEVFSHVATGLRRIDEAVTFLETGALERVGHALALAPDCPGQGHALIPNEEWGRTLCWARAAFRECGHDSSFVEQQLENWVEELRARMTLALTSCASLASLPSPTPAMLEDAFRRLSQPYQLSKVGYPFERVETSYARASGDAERLLVFLLSNKHYNEWATGRERREDFQQEDLDKLRELIIEKIVKEIGVAIEACPTSNVTIGDLAGYYHGHPAMYEYSHDGQASPRVSLNTDDPIQFVTNLRTEYWLMFRAKVELADRKTAISWLQDRRVDGLLSSFLKGRPATPKDWEELWGEWGSLETDPDFVAAIERPDIEGFWRFGMS